MCGNYTLMQIARLWSKVDTTSNPRGCWPWQGSVIEGYPHWKPNGQPDETPVRATRTVLELKLGRPLADGMKACHECDFPLCMRPDHLWEGTQAQNMADSVSKGRKSGHPGYRDNKSKLTLDQVREIKAALERGVSSTVLSKRYGVARGSIAGIRDGKSYRDVT